MQTIVGVGTAGCNIARKFENYPQYKVLKVDSEDVKEKRYLKLPVYDTPEEYEAHEAKTGNFFRGVSDESVLFVLCGASTISGISLVLMEKLVKKGCGVQVLYIYPEVDLMGESKTLQERVARNVLQQYARSGALGRIYMISNIELEKMIDNITIMNYHESLNEMLVSTVHMINVFNNTKSVSDTFSRPVPSAKISTYGFVDFSTGEEKMFFPIDNIREIRYYYGIPKSKLETEAHLFRKIVDQVKSRKTENIKVSYGIFATDYEHEYVYMVAHSSRIQEIEKN
tara:strand:+ start:2269 stop:3120 length:852 start_codon:yes stop_codon:yes gene_type:complete